MKKTFSIKTLFKDSWKDYKSNWKLFIIIGIIFLVVGFVGHIETLLNPITEFHFLPHIGVIRVIQIIGSLFQIFLSLGFIRLLLNIIDKKEYKIKQLFSSVRSLRHFVYFAMAVFIYAVLTSIGMLLFIIPGLILLVVFIFVQYLIAEEKAEFFESFKKSYNMTQGNRWKIFLLMIVIIFFNIFGTMAFFIGLAITIPMSYIIYARLYRTLGSGLIETNITHVSVDIEETEKHDREEQIQ